MRQRGKKWIAWIMAILFALSSIFGLILLLGAPKKLYECIQTGNFESFAYIRATILFCTALLLATLSVWYLYRKKQILTLFLITGMTWAVLGVVGSYVENIVLERWSFLSIVPYFMLALVGFILIFLYHYYLKSPKYIEARETIYKKSLFEICFGFFGIIGVVGAISFAGFNSFYLYRDFVITNRPYLKITLQKLTKISKMPISFKTYEQEGYLFIGKEAFGVGVLNCAIEIKNIGKTPAIVKEISLKLRKPDDPVTFTFVERPEEKKWQTPHLIFPDEEIVWRVENTISSPKKQHRKSDEDALQEYDNRIDKLRNEKILQLQIAVKYDIFNETGRKQSSPYGTERIFRIDLNKQTYTTEYYFAK